CKLVLNLISVGITSYSSYQLFAMDDGMYRPGLDMSHGFVKEIIKNQIDRDEYHRLMEERKEEYKNEIKGVSREWSRPAPSPMPAQIYVPPHRRKYTGERGSSASKRRLTAPSSPMAPGFISDREELRIREKVRSQVKALGDIDVSAIQKSTSCEKSSSKALFKLNIAANGESHEIVVLSSDNPSRLSKGLSRQYGLSEEECRLLRQTLEREIETRIKS
ncbi:hypothetical protein PRIPAC_85920, partial [Pristionchus pacificus]